MLRQNHHVQLFWFGRNTPLQKHAYASISHPNMSGSNGALIRPEGNTFTFFAHRALMGPFSNTTKCHQCNAFAIENWLKAWNLTCNSLLKMGPIKQSCSSSASTGSLWKWANNSDCLEESIVTIIVRDGFAIKLEGLIVNASKQARPAK